MHWPATVRPGSRDRIPTYLIGLGAALTLELIAEIGLLFAVDRTSVFDGPFLVGVVTTIPFLAAIVGGGYWLRSADLSPIRYPRVVGWCLGGAAVYLGINLALMAVSPLESWIVVWGWCRWAIVIGAGVGLLVGCLEGRAIERALSAERAELRATYLEDQRDFLDYLNSILRHEVLNTATVINGYATLLRDEASLSDQHREWAEIVIEESDEMSTVIDDVRVLLRVTEGEHQLRPVNISRVLADEVGKLEHKWGPVEVETSIPDGVSVRADELLARVFGNLLSNAVQHNDAERPRVSITANPGPETVRIDIADNGPGIPAEERDTLFDRVESRGSTHGLGLYLVDRLVAQYDGSVELTETGSDGSVFTVWLPTADLEDDGRGDASLEASTNGAS